MRVITVYSIALNGAMAVAAMRSPINRRPHAEKSTELLGETTYNELFGRSAKACSSTSLSCHNTTAASDLCCFNAPGGLFAQTQFWDASPSIGPSNSWTLHGLWPDHCDGTYDSTCDSSRQYTGIGNILTSFGKSDLVNYMNTYWKTNSGSDESFWEHEWGKHGTCVSTLKTSCYTNYQSKQEVVDYFQKAVDLFKTLDSYSFLSAAGITPSSSKTYTSAQISAALKSAFGFNVQIECEGSNLNQVYYYYNVQGSLQSGTFKPTNALESGSCPSSGIKYLPKSGSPASTTGTRTTTPATTTRPTATSAPTSTGTFSGRGYLQAVSGGSQQGCLISAGKWFSASGSSCATFTATAADSSTFTLSSSKGACAIVSGIFTCSSSTTAGSFSASGGYLASDDGNMFYAAAVPAGSTQQAVGTSSNSVQVQFQWAGV